jgi:hypothetical protein
MRSAQTISGALWVLTRGLTANFDKCTFRVRRRQLPLSGVLQDAGNNRPHIKIDIFGS